MQGRGFEPLKAEPAGLQPAPFGHSGTPARLRSVAASRSGFAPTIHAVEHFDVPALGPGPHTRAGGPFDVLVVGAGPAGSATAIRLAQGGANVLLADRARFPRDKP